MPELMALSVHQPWAWAIASGLKAVENRTWAPNPSFIGRRLAIHASQTVDTEGIGDCMRILSALGNQIALPGTFDKGCLVALATVAGVVTESMDPWFFGPHGWVLVDVVRIDPPIPCRGRQRLWRVPEDITNALQAAGHTIHTR